MQQRVPNGSTTQKPMTCETPDMVDFVGVADLESGFDSRDTVSYKSAGSREVLLGDSSRNVETRVVDSLPYIRFCSPVSSGLDSARFVVSVDPPDPIDLLYCIRNSVFASVAFHFPDRALVLLHAGRKERFARSLQEIS